MARRSWAAMGGATPPTTVSSGDYRADTPQGVEEDAGAVTAIPIAVHHQIQRCSVAFRSGRYRAQGGGVSRLEAIRHRNHVARYQSQALDEQVAEHRSARVSDRGGPSQRIPLDRPRHVGQRWWAVACVPGIAVVHDEWHPRVQRESGGCEQGERRYRHDRHVSSHDPQRAARTPAHSRPNVTFDSGTLHYRAQCCGHVREQPVSHCGRR